MARTGSSATAGGEDLSRRRLRAAVIGCGKIARLHASALDAAGIELVAVCDLDAQKAAEIAARSPMTRVFTDVDLLLAQTRPDVVHVTTPPSSHAALAIKVAEAGAHILVEKPVALSTAEIDAVIAAAERGGVRLIPTHNYLFKPSVRRAVELVRSGEVGEVVHVETYYGVSETTNSSPGAAAGHWANHLPGGVFTNFLPHVVYLQSAFVGGIRRVDGVAMAHARGAGHGGELAVVVEGQNATGVMVISTRAQPYAKYVRVFGTKGIVHADLVGEVTTVHRQRRMPRLVTKVLFNLEPMPQIALGTAVNTARVLTGAMRNMPDLHRFVDELYVALESGDEPPVGAQDARAVVTVMEEIRQHLDRRSGPESAQSSPALVRQPRTEAERRIVAGGGISGTVLVTGGTGYLGRHLVAGLLRCGARVRVLVRDASRVPDDLAGEAEFVVGNVIDRESLDAAMRGADHTVHCAAVTTNSVRWRIHEQTNIDGTRAVLAASREAGVRRLVHVSSVIVYGVGEATRGPVSETAAAPSEISPWAYYLRSKLAGENLARNGAERPDDVVVVRPGIIYGPGAPPRPGRVQLGSLQIFIGRGRNHLPYTYIDNVVDGILLALTRDEAAGQTYNLVDEPQLAGRDIAARYAHAKGESVRVLGLPATPMRLLAAALERRYDRAGAEVPPKLSRFQIATATRDLRYDTDKARRELGWAPEITLEEGLRRTSGLEPV